MDDGNDIQAALLDLTGQKTVPNVFIKGEHLGGNDNTQAAAKSGKLAEMLGNWVKDTFIKIDPLQRRSIIFESN